MIKNMFVKLSVVSLSAGLALSLMATNSSVLAATQTSNEERLQRIERIIENPVLLQLSRRLGEQQREIQELQDQIDYLKRDLRKVNRLSDKRNKESDDRLSELESTRDKLKTQKEAYVAPLSVQESAPTLSMQENDALVIPITTHPATEKEQVAYQLAFNLIKNSQYDAAIQAFQAFLDNHKKSELASNASYWMGEAFYIQQVYSKALNAFNLVINAYPHTSKVADAMLRAGDCLENLKQLNKAKDRYAGLIALHPKTRAAEKAIKRLETLQ
ncbi:TPR repeat containing exported protein; Putative periplasmic protein contains a protein prenylyltransferase domain [hydrothermal vent metagenome]|uniref:TPR repeat containing exported protein Putative periplasmic protein contains a protein prenylyltransferase domain n=1 Tax=hydrothermal vent metagenome TaxID=652676 RepID=A0A3B0WRY8_9ZZZZ